MNAKQQTWVAFQTELNVPTSKTHDLTIKQATNQSSVHYY